MSGANYWHCEVCNQKALYDYNDESTPGIAVVHTACLEKDRADRERQVREKTADVFRADDNLAYTTDHAVTIVLTGAPRPSTCECGHDKDRHRDLVAGWTHRDMTTFPNAGRCQDCGCPRFDQDAAAIACGKDTR